MSSSLLITLEMAGVLGIVLLLGGWELWSLRKDKASDQTQDKGPDKADLGPAVVDESGDHLSSPDSGQNKQPHQMR